MNPSRQLAQRRASGLDISDIVDWARNVDKTFRGKNRSIAPGSTADIAIVQPLKTAWNVLGAEDLQRGILPDASIKDRVMGAVALGGAIAGFGAADNVAQIGARLGRQATSGSRSALARRLAQAKQKLTPVAGLDDYIVHGGPVPERLVGGVIDPNYVRGGKLQSSPSKIYQPSVAEGPNAAERLSLLNKAQDAQNVIAGARPNRTSISNIEDAQSWLNRHQEILRRIAAGEEHSTGTNVFDASQTFGYSMEGGAHVLRIPEQLRTIDTPAPGGEIKFWGKHRPLSFVPFEHNHANMLQKTTQAVLDEADKASLQKQKLANALARARGQEISPAFKEFFQKLVEKNFGGSMPSMTRNPEFGSNPREILEYFGDFGNMQRQVVNYDDIVNQIKQAKTQNELVSILDRAIPNEQLDIYLGQTLNRSTFADRKAAILKRLENINPNYGRFGK